MSRLPPLRRQDLDARQRALWDKLAASHGAGRDLTDQGGGLVGPLNAFVRIPEVGERMAALGGSLLGGIGLEQRLVELATCVVAANARAEYAFWRHQQVAESLGCDHSALQQLWEGQVPDWQRDDDRLVHGLITQLMTVHRVSDDTYSAARDLFGESTLIELTMVVGYYYAVCSIVNVFEVPVPGEQDPCQV